MNSPEYNPDQIDIQTIRDGLHDNPNAKFSIRDRMQFNEGWQAIDAETGRSLVDCRVYVTNRQGTYGYQFAAAVWVHTGNNTICSASGRTTGYGYCKVSTAISDALQGIGYPVQFGGTGTHTDHVRQLAAAVANGRKFHLIHAHG